MISTKACRIFIAILSFAGTAAAFSQVSPTEVKDPRAKADEQKYLPQIVALQKAIGESQFPFTFRLARYLDAKPGQRAALDSNGIEFVAFHDRVVLKVSGFYRVAFNSIQVSQNGRAGQTMQDAVLPILKLVTEQIPQSYDYDAIGFEILYDARDSNGAYDFEGREVLTAVIGRDDAFALVSATDDVARQEILDRSDLFVNGKEFAVALGQRDPGEARPAERPSSQPSVERVSFKAARPSRAAAVSPDVTNATPRAVDSPALDVDAAAVQKKLQGEVNAIRNGDGVAERSVAAPAPSLETSGDEKVLHFTMQNTLSFERQTSIYKRAAQSFDLFLAPELKGISKTVPEDASVNALRFSVLNQLGTGKEETIEYICPMDSMRSFVENKITTQDLINKSTVLVNGVRIGLDLQLVE